MSERGIYGAPRSLQRSERGIYGVRLGASLTGERGSSAGTWIVGGLVIAGATLWAKYRSDQIEKLYVAVGLPHKSFIEDLRAHSRELSGAARDKIHALTRPRSAKKEA